MANICVRVHSLIRDGVIFGKYLLCLCSRRKGRLATLIVSTEFRTKFQTPLAILYIILDT